MSKQNTLKGLATWVRMPSSVSGAISGLLAVSYGSLTLQFPTASLPTFVGVGLFVIAFAVLTGTTFEARGMKTLGELGKSTLPPTKENLQTAIREARSAPDRAFKFTLLLWFCGSTALGLVFAALTPSVPWSMGLQMMWIGILFGPISATLTYLLDLFRSRVAVEKIARVGLSPAEVAQADPPGRAQLRVRLIIFMSIAVLTPAVLAADLAISKSNAVFEQVLKTKDRQAQRAAVDSAAKADLLSIVVLAAFVIALTLFETVLAARALSQPMSRMRDEAAQVASGEVKEVALIPCEDELWFAAASFSGMQGQLKAVLERLQHAGSKLSSGSTQLVSSTVANEEGAAEQAASLNETSATTEELARSARQIAENAAAVAEIAQRTYAAAQHGQKSSDAFQQSMAKMRSGNQAIADSVVKLNKRVQQIGKIVEFINELADKSDLLALNAELEGNKAGEVGRGFSLVAAEMRRLAENVLTSTREIERLIHEVRDATNAAVMATEAGVKATDAGALLATRVSANLTQILDLARQTSDSVRAISLATQQQQTGTDQLASAMAEILRVTEQSAQASRQMADANQDLSSLSTELSKVVQRFKVA